MQVSKRVLVKSTAVYDSLLREREQEVTMPLIESQLIAIGEHGEGGGTLVFRGAHTLVIAILRTWVQKSTLLQNRGHAEVLKKDPFFREISNASAPPPPLCTLMLTKLGHDGDWTTWQVQRVVTGFRSLLGIIFRCHILWR